MVINRGKVFRSLLQGLAVTNPSTNSSVLVIKRLISTCSLRLGFKMEGVQLPGAKREIVEPFDSPLRKKAFLGISPLKNSNMPSPSQRPFRVSVEGNIGAGKSTMIKYFEKMSLVETHSEPIEWWRNCQGHNLLDLLYTDIKQWINVFQSYVMLTRLKIQTAPPSSPNVKVQMFERSVQNNRFCFLEQAYRSGNLEHADYTVLDLWYRWIREHSEIGLDLIVYLRTSPEVAFERVKARARPEENSLSLEYLKALHNSHEQWLMSNNERFNTIPVLVLDANKSMEELFEEYKKYEKRILGNKSLDEIPEEQKSNVRRNLDENF